jgi:putative nucleotidyltransferase with HDIG domain
MALEGTLAGPSGIRANGSRRQQPTFHNLSEAANSAPKPLKQISSAFVSRMKMLKRIAKDQLRVGMFIEAFEGEWLDTPFARRRFMLVCTKETERLKNGDVSGIFINTSKGTDSLPAVERQGKTRAADHPAKTIKLSSTRALKERASTTTKIRKTSALLKCIFEDIGAGAAVSVEMVSPVIEEIMSSLDTSPTILTNMTRLKSKDEATFLHCLAVSALMIRFARHLKLDAEIIPILGIGGLLHDIGKVGMPIEILTKAGALTDCEMDVVRRHPVIGHHILSRGNSMPEIVLDICLHHHERLDGKGYPNGLVDGQISFYARMAAICDVYDALTSARPYKKPWAPSEAASWMLGTTGFFDRPLLRQFVEL